MERGSSLVPRIRLSVFGIQKRDLLSTLNGHSDWVNSVAYSFDGSRTISGSADKTILIWNTQNGKKKLVSPDSKQTLSGSRDATARVWNAITGKPLFPPFRGHMCSVTSVCFFPDGTRFVTGSDDGELRIWTLDEVQNTKNFISAPKEIYTLPVFHLFYRALNLDKTNIYYQLYYVSNIISI